MIEFDQKRENDKLLVNFFRKTTFFGRLSKNWCSFGKDSRKKEYITIIN